MNKDIPGIDRLVENKLLTVAARMATLMGVPIGLTVLSWAGWMLLKTSTELAILTTKFEPLAAVVYRLPEAERDLKLRDERIAIINRDIAAIERRLERVETR